MDVTKLQKRLNLMGKYAGAIDGDFGPKTLGAILSVVAPKWTKYPDLAKFLWAEMKRADITSPLRIAHFLAQASHETAGFTTLKEYGGPSYFARYDGRKDLGNVKPGDGAKFCGRGVFQTTGRANYTALGKHLGCDLVTNPQLLEQPEMAAKSAVNYWETRKLEQYADHDDVVLMTRRINGGQNGLAERRSLTSKIKALFA